MRVVRARCMLCFDCKLYLMPYLFGMLAPAHSYQHTTDSSLPSHTHSFCGRTHPPFHAGTREHVCLSISHILHTHTRRYHELHLLPPARQRRHQFPPHLQVLVCLSVSDRRHSKPRNHVLDQHAVREQCLLLAHRTRCVLGLPGSRGGVGRRFAGPHLPPSQKISVQARSIRGSAGTSAFVLFLRVYACVYVCVYIYVCVDVHVCVLHVVVECVLYADYFSLLYITGSTYAQLSVGKCSSFDTHTHTHMHIHIHTRMHVYTTTQCIPRMVFIHTGRQAVAALDSVAAGRQGNPTQLQADRLLQHSQERRPVHTWAYSGGRLSA